MIEERPQREGESEKKITLKKNTNEKSRENEKGTLGIEKKMSQK